MIYLQLFLSFLQIGALSFGGGYAAMPSRCTAGSTSRSLQTSSRSQK